MSTKKEAWGVEVGAQAIKAMKLGKHGDDVVLLDFDVMPFKQVLTTPDLNVQEAIRVNLDALATKHEFDKSNVVISVPGHMAFARFAKLPPVESKNVKSIVAYEAQQQIPFPIEEVEWDYQVFAQEDAPDIEVGIFAITKERIANYLSNYRSVGMRVDALTLSPVAVYNAFAHENTSGTGHGSGTVYLDIGTTATDIIVVEDETIWLRTLPLGGNHFTEALMKQFKISFAKAEKLKLEAATSKYAKQIYQALRGVFNDLVTEIERSLGFYTSLNREADLSQIVGVGSTWKLPGLQKYIKQNTRMEVIRPDGFAQIQVEDRRAASFSSVAMNMATAYGLALQGLGSAAVDANILPQSVLRQRMWKAKQPWIVAAAACVAGAAALGPITQFLEGQSYNSAWTAVKDDITSTITEAQGFKTTYNTVQTTDPRPGIRNYRRGFDYTNLYASLYDDVTTALSTIKVNEKVANVDWDNPEDVNRVASLPRAERDFVWFTRMSTTYQAPVAADASSAESDFDSSMDQAPPSFEDGFPPPSAMDMGIGTPTGSAQPQAGTSSLTPIPFPVLPESSIAAPGGEGQEPTASVDPLKELANNPAPRMIVTVQGETTMNGAEISRALNNKLVEWMKNHSERPDRPYIIVPELIDPRFSPRPAMSVTGTSGGLGPQGSGTDLNREPSSQTSRTQPGTGLSGPGFAPPGGGFGNAASPGNTGNSVIEIKTPEGWYAKLNGSNKEAGFSLNALYPRRALSAEKRDGDYNFTFKFEVILLPPDKARTTILPAAPQDNDDSAQNVPASPTAASPNQEDQA